MEDHGERKDKSGRVGVFGLSPKDPAIADVFSNKSKRVRTAKRIVVTMRQRVKG